MTSPIAEKRKAGDDAGEAPKKQKTIEDTLKPASRAGKSKQDNTHRAKDESVSSDGTEHLNNNTTNGNNAFDEVKSDATELHPASPNRREMKNEDDGYDNGSIQTSEERAKAVPASIMEKGIIYFFFRGRVGVNDPNGVEDVARSYIVLRPLPRGAKVGDGPLEDINNGRVLALPKKVLPKGGQDKFLVFVDRKGLSVEELRDVFKGNEYATKTAGTSNKPAATPVAEGVYALTSTGKLSHLAYRITMPIDLGEVQEALGVHKQGSFVCSIKNPQAPGPANATIDNPAQYPESVMKKFAGRRWCPMEPEMMEYEGTQMLLIGEGVGDAEKALEESGEDRKDEDKVPPATEVEQLAEEDHERVEGLKDDDPIFADLGLSSEKYPHLQTTW